MMGALLIVLSACLSLHAQVFESPASFVSLSISKPVVSPPTPATLVGGETLLAWYQPPLATNSSVLTVTNLAATGSNYNLTNSQAAGATWAVGGDTVNGKPAVRFKASSMYLKNDLFTNSTPQNGFVIGMVISVTNIGTGYFCSSTNSASGHTDHIQCSATATCRYGDGSGSDVLFSFNGLTNQWLSLIVKAQCNGSTTLLTNIVAYTNGVSAGNVTPGTHYDQSGLTLGNYPAVNAGGTFAWADFEIYTNLSAQSITDLHTYHKNTFGTP